MKDKTTRKLFDLLIEKVRQGVVIRIIYDEIVNRTTFIGKWIQELNTAGIETYGYNHLLEGWHIDRSKGHPVKQIMMTAKLKLKQHFHEKYMVVDNEHLVLGGINWGDKYAFGGERPKAWRDTDCYIRGEVVRDVQLQFLKDFQMQKAWKQEYENDRRLKYQKFVLDYMDTYRNGEGLLAKYGANSNVPQNIDAPKRVAYVAHKPYDLNELTLSNLLLNKIKNASKRIYWGCHGIRPPKIFAIYLAEAVNRGVEVRLITNSKKSARTLMVNGLLGWMYWECTKHYKTLLENGVRIFEWQKPGAFHSKNLVIDDDFVSIGSFNIANGSTFHHSESNILVEDVGFCEQVVRQFEIDLESCKEINLNEFSFPKMNAYNRILHQRYKMLEQALVPPVIRKDLDAGKFKEFPMYEFIDIS